MLVYILGLFQISISKILHERYPVKAFTVQLALVTIVAAGLK